MPGPFIMFFRIKCSTCGKTLTSGPIQNPTYLPHEQSGEMTDCTIVCDDHRTANVIGEMYDPNAE